MVEINTLVLARSVVLSREAIVKGDPFVLSSRLIRNNFSCGGLATFTRLEIKSLAIVVNFKLQHVPEANNIDNWLTKSGTDQPNPVYDVKSFRLLYS